MKKRLNPSTVNQRLYQIQAFQDKVNSLNDAVEFEIVEYLTFPVNSRIPSLRGMTICDSGLPHNTRNSMVRLESSHREGVRGIATRQ